MMKRMLSLLISVTLISGIAAPSAFAADAAPSGDPPASVLRLERIGGALGSLLGRILKLVTFTDESRIQKAASRDAAGQKSDSALFSGAAEQTLRAETWRAVELSFESEKAYNDPFGDVTLDLLLYGNGRRYTSPGFWDGGDTGRVRAV